MILEAFPTKCLSGVITFPNMSSPPPWTNSASLCLMATTTSFALFSSSEAVSLARPSKPSALSAARTEERSALYASSVSGVVWSAIVLIFLSDSFSSVSVGIFRVISSPLSRPFTGHRALSGASSAFSHEQMPPIGAVRAGFDFRRQPTSKPLRPQS